MVSFIISSATKLLLIIHDLSFIIMIIIILLLCLLKFNFKFKVRGVKIVHTNITIFSTTAVTIGKKRN